MSVDIIHIHEERASDSPYVETVTRGYTEGSGSTIRPATSNWHMVFVRHNGRMLPFVVGPLTAAGALSWAGAAEVLWIKFKLGAFMPHLPTRDFLNLETILPAAVNNGFWLHSSAWEIPDYENVETFVDRLVRQDVLVRDPVVNAVLQEQPQDLSSRTVRHRLLRATGLPHGHIRQLDAAHRP